MLREISRVLAIPPHRLGIAATSDINHSEPETEDMHRRTVLAAGIAALAAPTLPSTAHQDLVQSLLPGTARVTAEPVPDLQSMRDQVTGVRRLFYTCDYTKLEGTLPVLIGQLRQAISDGPGSSDLSGLLATVYQTSASLLLKQSDQGNAWLAVGRAMSEAERSGDPVVLASSVRVHAHALARDSHTAQAVTLVRHTADQLTGSYDQRSPKYLAALGLLLLRGVTAASSGGDRSATRDFLTEAKEVARYVALDSPDAWANFSPTNVALHGLSAAVAFGDAGVALDTARRLSCAAISPSPSVVLPCGSRPAAPTASRAAWRTGTRPFASQKAARPRTSDARPSVSWWPTWPPATVAVRCRNCTVSAVNWEFPRE